MGGVGGSPPAPQEVNRNKEKEESRQGKLAEFRQTGKWPGAKTKPAEKIPWSKKVDKQSKKEERKRKKELKEMSQDNDDEDDENGVSDQELVLVPDGMQNHKLKKLTHKN